MKRKQNQLTNAKHFLHPGPGIVLEVYWLELIIQRSVELDHGVLHFYHQWYCYLCKALPLKKTL